jgi:branched-chain amino acid aminotransferase
MSIIALDQLSGHVWLNNQFIDWKAANVHLLTHSLHYGSSVFEGERAYGGKIFKLREHTERLFKSAQTYGMKIPYSVDEIIKASEECLKKNNITEAYVRPLVWYGPENVWISTKEHSIHVMIAAWCPPSYLKQPLKKRLNVCLSRWIKPNAQMIPADCKSAANYPMLTLSKNEAIDNGFDDAIMLDSKDNITECTSSNIFFYKKGELFTPLADCFLNGITRQTVLELAVKRNIKCHERHLTLNDILEMEECFITGTACEIQGINSITLSQTKNAHAKKIIFEKTEITDILLNDYKTLVTSSKIS